MNQEMFEQIFFMHKGSLKNLEFENPKKIIIAFSGVPGSGKSTLAKLIEEKFNFIRLNNDDIRSIISDVINETVSSPNVNSVGKEYLFSLMNRIKNGKNRSFILDSSIDRGFSVVSEWTNQNGFKLIIIKLEVEKEEIIQRIKKRNGENAENYFLDHERQWSEYLKFNQEHSVDLIYRVGKDTELLNFIENILKGVVTG